MPKETAKVRDSVAAGGAEVAEVVMDVAADVKSRLQEKVSHDTRQVHKKASEITGRVRDLTPDNAQEGVSSAARSMRKRPVIYAIAAALLFGGLISRVRRSRK